MMHDLSCNVYVCLTKIFCCPAGNLPCVYLRSGLCLTKIICCPAGNLPCVYLRSGLYSKCRTWNTRYHGRSSYLNVAYSHWTCRNVRENMENMRIHVSDIQLERFGHYDGKAVVPAHASCALREKSWRAQQYSVAHATQKYMST